jgi:hypothetical protein
VRHEKRKLCCTEDEGRPLGTAIQVEVSNHLKLLWSKAMVVSVKEKVLLERIRYLLRRRIKLNRCGSVEIKLTVIKTRAF